MPSTALYAFTQLKFEPVTNPDLARQIAVLLKPSTTFVRGEILGEISASPGVYAKFDPTANDGTQLPKGALAYSVVTNASGLGAVSGAFPAVTDRSFPLWVRGDFDCALVATAMGDSGALLAAALQVPGFGALEQGTAAAGTFRIG